ncbi:hypothetical protein VB636_21040 [Paracoccus sp. APAP_BH8]|uniref:Uncharacterized protein n=1 Tax=Paracoccus pantotrophus TaxID=82367 RepID=A0A7H9BX44_PARPN|nr:hypothetical protein [Paracoccus pantotrophus]MDF3854591.1 hypothetical protein [Paracoccus pantotrophus]QLH15609.1 hypothetical protein HYQ43_15710 [Paracoccus pantotrophus]WGR63821.1 hypothetical protein E3U24_00165 [Paracoccus pantotrophus]
MRDAPSVGRTEEYDFSGALTRIWTIGGIAISVSAFSVGIKTALVTAAVPELSPEMQEPWLIAVALMALSLPAMTFFTVVLFLDLRKLWQVLIMPRSQRPVGRMIGELDLTIAVLFGAISASWGVIHVSASWFNLAFPGAVVGIARHVLLIPENHAYFFFTVFAVTFSALAFGGTENRYLRGFFQLCFILVCCGLLVFWADLLL